MLKLEKINNFDFSEIEKLIDRNFSSLVWYVFSYDDNWYNETIFKEFLWLDLEEFENIEIFLKKANKSLKIKIKDFEKLIEKIISDKIYLGKAKNYILKNLQESLNFVKNLENIIKIEAQKIKKFNFKLEKTKLKKILEKIEKFEKTIYWENLSENQQYSLEIIDSLEKDFEENKEKLNQEEMCFMENTLRIFREKTWNIWKIYKEEKKIKNLKDPLDKQQEILDKEIERKDYIKIFELTLKILGINDIKVETDEKTWNLKVSPGKIHIPTNKNYDKLKIKKIIDLISHEIETHVITQKNNENLVWFIKPIWYTIKEEWVAWTFWMLASWKNLKEIIKPSRNVYQILFCELIWWLENLKTFLKINQKMFPESKINIPKKIERLKRWRDFEETWVNPKEKSYFLGRKKVVDKLSIWENFFHFFIWRNSFEMEDELAKIIKNNDKTFSIEIFKEKWIIFPLMIWEILKYKLLSKSEKNDWLFGWFLKYFCEKYWNLLNKLWINYKDFIKNYILSEKEENKKRIKEILEIFTK